MGTSASESLGIALGEARAAGHQGCADVRIATKLGVERLLVADDRFGRAEERFGDLLCVVTLPEHGEDFDFAR